MTSGGFDCLVIICAGGLRDVSWFSLWTIRIRLGGQVNSSVCPFPLISK